MSDRIIRNQVVFILGTPQRTEGSLNNPVVREEYGILFNEKWIYENVRTDPAGAPERMVYWFRYDFAGTMVRDNPSAEWRHDTALIEAAKREPDRMPLITSNYRPLKPTRRYRVASEVKGPDDLGGYIQPESEIRPAIEEKPA